MSSARKGEDNSLKVGSPLDGSAIKSCSNTLITGGIEVKPEAVFVLLTWAVKSGGGLAAGATIFLNVCQSPMIDAPGSPQIMLSDGGKEIEKGDMPVSIGLGRPCTINTGEKGMVYDVIFNSKVFSDPAKSKWPRDFICQLSLMAVAFKHELELNMMYVPLKLSIEPATQTVRDTRLQFSTEGISISTTHPMMLKTNTGPPSNNTDSQIMNQSIYDLMDGPRGALEYTLPMENAQLSRLHKAAARGNSRLVQQCLSGGDDVNVLSISETKFKATPLYYAVQFHHKHIVKMLLEAKADANIVGSNGTSPLFLASQRGDTDMITMLLHAGADINGRIQPGGLSPLHICARMGLDCIVETLIAASADVNVQANYGWTALHYAIREGEEECTRLLLKAEADVCKVNDDGASPLHFASITGQLGIMEALISRGSDVNGVANVIGTPLMAACYGGHLQAINILLDARANINIPNGRGWSPLMVTGELPNVKFFLEKGACVHHIDNEGNGVLHHAGIYGRSSAVICTLYKAGASPVLLNKQGNTPADCARSKDHHDTAVLLDMLAVKYREKENSSETQEYKKSADVPISLDTDNKKM